MNKNKKKKTIVSLKVPSINQLKQSPFPVCLSQDPWAPVNNSNQVRNRLDISVSWNPALVTER